MHSATRATRSQADRTARHRTITHRTAQPRAYFQTTTRVLIDNHAIWCDTHVVERKRLSKYSLTVPPQITRTTCTTKAVNCTSFFTSAAEIVRVPCDSVETVPPTRREKLPQILLTATALSQRRGSAPKRKKGRRVGALVVARAAAAGSTTHHRSQDRLR